MTSSFDPLYDPGFVQALLDTVIPPGADGRMPGAGSLGIEDAVAATVDADARSGPLIRAGLAAIATEASARAEGGFPALSPADRVAVVNAVVVEHPQLMNAFARHVYLAYYQHPGVLVAIGEPPHPPFPGGFTIAPTDPELQAKLMERRIGRPSD